MSATLDRIHTLSNELVELKAQIHKANQPVYDKIFALAELKGMIKELKKVSTEEGKVSERYGSVVSVKEVELNVTDIDSILMSGKVFRNIANTSVESTPELSEIATLS